MATKSQLIEQVKNLQNKIINLNDVNIALCRTAKDTEDALSKVIAQMVETDLGGSNSRLNDLACILKDAALELAPHNQTLAGILIAKAEVTLAYLKEQA